MKIEICENTWWVCFTAICATAVVGLILGSVWICQETTRQAFKAGYVEQQQYGQASTMWVKGPK